MRNHAVIVALLVLLPIGLVATARARAEANEKRNVWSGSPLTWSVEPIIDRYVKNMARHYNLNPEQEEYTRQLLNQRVKRFLNDYEKDVRSLFAEYYYYQVQKEIPSADVAKDWARRGGPLTAAIRKEILDGNKLWRQILDEEQRKKHDRDLDLMNRQFDRFEEQMKRWSDGDVRPSDIISGQVSPGAHRIWKFEDAWEYRVRSFIQAYDLDEGQQQTARSILRELRQEAARYRETHREEFAELEAQFKEISESSPKNDEEELKKAREELKALNQRRIRLEHPIRVVLFNQLLARLDRIPTEAQRQRRQAHLRKLSVRRGTTKPATASRPATTTQPATTQPANAARS